MMTASSPLVSAIVCTYNRPTLLLRALDSVCRQDLDEFEIIAIDDGSEPPVELPERYRSRVQLVRASHRGVGAARSEGLNRARGAFVAYCDDDDVWTPNHLSVLLQYLIEHPDVALVYADSEWRQEGAPSSDGYSFDYELSLLVETNYIFAGDVMCRSRAARDVGGFDPSLQVYEDWDLWLRMSQAYTIRHLPVVLGAHYWHEDCVTAGDHWREWKQVHQRHQRRLTKEGIAPGHRPMPIVADPVPFDRRTWQEGRRELVWHSVMQPNHHSFGHVSRQLIPRLEGLGIDVTMAPVGDQPLPEFERCYKSINPEGRLAFYYHYSPDPRALRCARLIIYSMWESTLIPKQQVDQINRAAVLLYVPCRQNAESFRDCGVSIPITILHHGVDADQFPFLTRPRRECFTFGTYGVHSHRKGIDLLIRAFQDEFSPRDSVRLLLKSAASGLERLVKDSRIRVMSGFTDQSALLNVLCDMDAFVMPSRGEGFGLCGLEAMSTGLPIIATNWSGPADYMDPADSFLLSYRLKDARGIEIRGNRFDGLWAEPDYEHLRYLMRWLYEHPDEAAAKGRMAAQRVQKEWTWDRVAKQMRDDFDAIARE